MSDITDDRGFNQVWERNNTFKVRIERRAKLMLEIMDNKNGEINILEIGSGTGEISYFIAKNTQANVLGIDICRPFVENANKEFVLPNLRYEFINFTSGELKGMKFDYIIGNGILHHLYYHLDDDLLKIKNLLKDKGKLIFLEPNILNPYCYLIFKFNYFRNLAKLEPDEMAFSRKFIKEKLEILEMKNINVTYKDFLLPNTPEKLIHLVIWIGDKLERIFPFNRVTQSILIVGQK
jgi:2-polyprenyl-3-methyl-5-hydroxy-6-metoxy-1,4-benzoquinol methylase